MRGYELSRILATSYELNREKLVAAQSKTPGEKLALARALTLEICTAGRGIFNPQDVAKIVEHDVLHGNPAIISSSRPNVFTVVTAPPPIKVTSAPDSNEIVFNLVSDVKMEAARRRVGYHEGDIGDVIFALAGIMDLGGITLYLGNDPAALKPCAPNGPRQPITKEIFNFLAPLLEVQPYIFSVRWADKYDAAWHNLNLYRRHFTKGGYDLNLAVEQAKAIGANPVCVYTKWLSVPPGGPKSADVIFARSPRYHNIRFPWHAAVEQYGKRAGFVGLKSEHTEFCKEFGPVEHIEVADALELAQVIEQCQLFIGNASAPHAIAEGLKKNMVVERYSTYEHAHFPRPNAIYFSHGQLPSIDRQPKIYHVVSRYIPRDSETKRRAAFAAASWEPLYQNYSVVPVHVWATDRGSSGIGDIRNVPYLKDLLQAGLDHARFNDDIVMFTNDDACLFPEVVQALKNHFEEYPCCTAFRLEYSGPVSSMDDLRPCSPQSPKAILSQGRDLFAFRKNWLALHLPKFPDYLIGTTDWDYYLSVYIRVAQGIKVTMTSIPEIHPATEIKTGYVWHEKHNPWWSRVENKYTSPAQRYNMSLTRKFFSSAQLKHMV